MIKNHSIHDCGGTGNVAMVIEDVAKDHGVLYWIPPFLPITGLVTGLNISVPGNP